MLAVRAGASRVYACEINATMVTMSHDIIAANGMMDKIAVIHKMSSDVQISNDIPERYTSTVYMKCCVLYSSHTMTAVFSPGYFGLVGPYAFFEEGLWAHKPIAPHTCT